MFSGFEGYEAIVGTVVRLIVFTIIVFGFIAWEIWNDG